jgi:protein prenyltransferase alpha subunit repeat containing protein 1
MNDIATSPTDISGEDLYEKLNEILDVTDSATDEIGFLVSIQQSGLENQNQIGSQFNQYFFLCEHKLGISYGILPKIARTANEKYHNYKQKNENEQIDVNSVNIFKKILRSLLIVNGDNYTAWNQRKQLILQDHITFDEEVEFSSLMLTKHKKSTETWAHRRWVLERLWKTRTLSAEDCSKEFELCASIAKTRVRNYYAWSHRLWCLQHADIKAWLEDYKWIQQWNKTMLSDYSAWHHREEILKLFLEYEKKQHNQDSNTDTSNDNNINPSIKLNMQPIWIRELEDNRDYILSYAGHESLWMYRRFLFSKWIQIKLEQQSTDVFTIDMTKHDASEGTIQGEISFVQSSILNTKVDEYGRSNNILAKNYARWILPKLSKILSGYSPNDDTYRTAINNTRIFLDNVTMQLRSIVSK